MDLIAFLHMENDLTDAKRRLYLSSSEMKRAFEEYRRFVAGKLPAYEYVVGDYDRNRTRRTFRLKQTVDAEMENARAFLRLYDEALASEKRFSKRQRRTRS